MYRGYSFAYRLIEAFSASSLGLIIACLLSVFTLTFCIRWFVFAKAGEKGWKALIPFYGDYIAFKLAWDGKIFLTLLIGWGAAFLTGFTFGLISGDLGGNITILLGVVVASLHALANLILQFKLARAFGQGNYFALGLYFLAPAFNAILAFGDCQYKGVPKDDGIGVPKVLENIGKKKQPLVGFQPMQPYGQPPMHQPPQPYQQGYQQPYQQGGYAPQQQPYGNGYQPVQQYPQQPNNQPPYNG